jgi:hypothetical protein
MQISRTVHIQLTEEQTYEALEQYIRRKTLCVHGIDLDDYEVDDADSSCGKDGKGAYFLFLKRKKEQSDDPK